MQWGSLLYQFIVHGKRVRERLALLFNLFFGEFQIFFFFFAKIECGLYLLDRFDVLISKIIFKK
jgi:hypothetical protein